MSEATARSCRRHDLVWVSPDRWERVLEELEPGHAADALVRNWVADGRPLIVRRRGPLDPPDGLCAGLALPPGRAKRRLAVSLREGDGPWPRREPPPLLRHTLDGSLRRAPAARWRPPIERLLDIAARHGVEPRIYGALMWECVTGLPYLTGQSDLDLLWPIDPRRHDVRGLLAALRLEREAALDGEVIVPGGAAAHWRELLDACETDGEVLVKTVRGVTLQTASDFLSGGR